MQRSGYVLQQGFQPYFHVEPDVGSGLIHRSIEYGVECKACGQSSPILSHNHIGTYAGPPHIPHRI